MSVRSEGVESQGNPEIGVQLENERPKEALVPYIYSSSIFSGRTFPDWCGILELHLDCVGIVD